jgi:hypothetical protein
LKLSKLWEFGKEAAKYTKAKPVPIPMFVLTVKLTTEKVTHPYGKSWIIDFEIEKSKDGTPELVTDPGMFQFLRDHVETVEDTIASLIETKSTEDDGKQVAERINAEGVEADEPPMPVEPSG